MTMKRTRIFVSVVAVALLLGACSNLPPDKVRTGNLTAYNVVLPDGGTVVCVTLYNRAVSCDWDGASNG